MSETAIVLLGNEYLLNNLWGDSSVARQSQQEFPLACQRILGASVLERTIERLQSSGVGRIRLVAQEGLGHFIPRWLRKRMVRIALSEDERPAVDRICREERSRGSETILLMRLGPYIEFDLPEILRFHYASGSAATTVCDCDGALPFWLLPTNGTNGTVDFATSADAAYETAGSRHYFVDGYVNRLANPYQLRQLIQDAFEGRCKFVPRGQEVKPGIWVGNGARIDPEAILVAPAYIGDQVRIRAAAMVGQSSNVECGSVIGRASIVDRSSVFARTRVGQGLHVLDSVVDGGCLTSLERNVTVEIKDRSLLCRLDPWRLLRFTRRPAKPLVFETEGAEIATQPSLGVATVPVHRVSLQESYEQLETCNRDALT